MWKSKRKGIRINMRMLQIISNQLWRFRDEIEEISSNYSSSNNGMFTCSLRRKSNTVESKAQETEAEETMTVDKDKKEIVMLCEVNGTYFTEPTRHGIVYKGGSNGEKAVLRGLADEKEFYQALLDIGPKPVII